MTIEGAGTRGGGVAGLRRVTAPAGIVRVDAAEMVVECGAATPVDELLAELETVGQTIAVPDSGTIGGALATGHSAITRLGHGAIRDVLLMAHYVGADGALVKAGGPTVKNVSGFDLCRLLVGSVGTLGFLGTVLLRTRPIAPCVRWFSSDRDPVELLDAVYRPVSMLWNGRTTWVRLDGVELDVEDAARHHQLVPVDGPPPLPPHRWSLRPGELPTLGEHDGAFVAEIGVGIVHRDRPRHVVEASDAIVGLHQRIAAAFDPTDRLNRGRSALRGA
ncbi:MAG: FAD-binding oxidoreductase [Ilumatobacter sp.]